MILLRQEGKLSQEGYIHQLTVQGRLPDEFKYAALALILAGPYQNNWQEPFYDAPWGSIAPLVHDGGKVKSNLNSFWNNVKGRTDFLHRVALVKEQKVEEIERLTPEECRRLSVEKLAAARAEQIERERLLLEVRFYQRIALALHCKLGGALEVIPENVRQVLTTRWQFFRERMDALLQEYDIHGACKVRWFTAKPRSLQRRDGRQEAKWPPIRKELIKLENVRRQHPEILDRAATLMEQVTKTIDQNLGLTL